MSAIVYPKKSKLMGVSTNEAIAPTERALCDNVVSQSPVYPNHPVGIVLKAVAL